MQAFPKSQTGAATVREALITAYAELNETDSATVSAGYDGGLPFDSLLGVELACAMEEHFGIEIPEERLLNPKLYRSLSAFATAVEKALAEQKPALVP